MNLSTLETVIEHLQIAIDLINADYRQTNDPTMRHNEITAKVVLSNMQKRHANAVELNIRNTLGVKDHAN